MKRKYIIMASLLLAISATSQAQMPNRQSHSITITNNQGVEQTVVDVGRFQAHEDNAVIVADGTDDTIVCRFPSGNNNCYRLSVTDGKGHVPVPLHIRAAFDNFADMFRVRAGHNICEIIDAPWSDWSVEGRIPTGPGSHSYTETRSCSTGGVAEACLDTCSVDTETRTRTVDNPSECVPSIPGPNPGTILAGEVSTYYNGCDDVQVVGRYQEPEPETPTICTPSIAGPDPSTILTGVVRPYHDGCENVQVVGTWDPFPKLFTLHCHPVFLTDRLGRTIPLFAGENGFSIDCHDGHPDDVDGMLVRRN